MFPSLASPYQLSNVVNLGEKKWGGTWRTQGMHAEIFCLYRIFGTGKHFAFAFIGATYIGSLSVVIPCTGQTWDHCTDLNSITTDDKWLFSGGPTCFTAFRGPMFVMVDCM